jgi:hypothetical protein
VCRISLYLPPVRDLDLRNSAPHRSSTGKIPIRIRRQSQVYRAPVAWVDTLKAAPERVVLLSADRRLGPLHGESELAGDRAADLGECEGHEGRGLGAVFYVGSSGHSPSAKVGDGGVIVSHADVGDRLLFRWIGKRMTRREDWQGKLTRSCLRANNSRSRSHGRRSPRHQAVLAVA